MLTTMKQDMTKAVSFGYTFHYIDDLFSVNNDSFEEYISSIYPSELELKDTTMASNEVCYLDTRIKQGDDSTPYHISMYDKRDDFDFRIVNFPHMDSNIPANPAYGNYISTGEICTDLHIQGGLPTQTPSSLVTSSSARFQICISTQVAYKILQPSWCDYW